MITPSVAPSRPGDSRHWLSTPPLRFRNVWLSFAAFGVAIVLLFGVIRTPPPLQWLILDDKLMHVLAYAAMSAAFAQILLDRRTRLLIVLLLVVFGLGVECLQTRTATRQFEWLDLLANTGGAFGAWLLIGRRETSLLPRLETLCRRRLHGVDRRVTSARRAKRLRARIGDASAPLRARRRAEERRSLSRPSSARRTVPGPGTPGAGVIRQGKTASNRAAFRGTPSPSGASPAGASAVARTLGPARRPTAPIRAGHADEAGLVDVAHVAAVERAERSGNSSRTP